MVYTLCEYADKTLVTFQTFVKKKMAMNILEFLLRDLLNMALIQLF